jgi:hypothetical protein
LIFLEDVCEEAGMIDYFRHPYPTNPLAGLGVVHDSKLVAWALFLGEYGQGAPIFDRSFRPHRGQLPDVDHAAALPAPHRPSPLRRLAHWLKSFASSEPLVGNVGELADIDDASRLAARDAAAQMIVVDQFRAT